VFLHLPHPLVNTVVTPYIPTCSCQNSRPVNTLVFPYLRSVVCNHEVVQPTTVNGPFHPHTFFHLSHLSRFLPTELPMFHYCASFDTESGRVSKQAIIAPPAVLPFTVFTASAFFFGSPGTLLPNGGNIGFRIANAKLLLYAVYC
jgi:hypothetical protein